MAKHKNRHTVVAELEQGGIGRPKVAIGREHLTCLLEINFPVSCIAGLLGVSYKQTVHRHVAEYDLSVKSIKRCLSDRKSVG